MVNRPGSHHRAAAIATPSTARARRRRRRRRRVVLSGVVRRRFRRSCATRCSRLLSNGIRPRCCVGRSLSSRARLSIPRASSKRRSGVRRRRPRARPRSRRAPTRTRRLSRPPRRPRSSAKSTVATGSSHAIKRCRGHRGQWHNRHNARARHDAPPATTLATFLPLEGLSAQLGAMERACERVRACGSMSVRVRVCVECACMSV